MGLPEALTGALRDAHRSREDYRSLLSNSEQVHAILANADSAAARGLRVSIARFERQHLQVDIRRVEAEMEMLRSELDALPRDDEGGEEQAIKRQILAEKQGESLVDGFADYTNRQVALRESFTEALRTVGCHPPAFSMQLPDFRPQAAQCVSGATL